MVPVNWGDVMDLRGRGKVMLSIYRDDATGGLSARWLGYYAPAETYPMPLSQYNVNTFTGYFFEITSDGYLANILQITNGIITGYHPGANSVAEGDNLDFRCDGFLGINWCCFWPFDTSCCLRCPRFGQNFWELVGDVAADVGGFIKRVFSNGNGGEPDPNFIPGVFHFSPFSNFGHHFGHSETGGGVSTGSQLNQYFSNQIFNQTYDPVKAQLIEQFKSDRGITLPSYVLMAMVSPYCFDEPESFDECAWWSMTNWINENAGPIWVSYYDRCLSQLPANETWNRWAMLMWRNGALFNYLVSNDINCRANGLVEPILDATDEAMDFYYHLLEGDVLSEQQKDELQNPNRVSELLGLIESGIEGGLSNEDIQYVVKGWIDNDGAYVPVKPIDWSQTDMQGRVTHLHKWLRYIHKVIDCDPSLALPFYSMRPPVGDEPTENLVGWFFYNAPSSQSGVTLDGSISYRYYNQGQSLGISIEWTRLWQDQRFRISTPAPVGTIDPNRRKIFYNYGETNHQNASVVTIYFPTASEDAFMRDFKSPCR